MFRYGQTKECFVYRLIATGTLDEMLSDQQLRKIKISNSVVDKILNLPYQELDLMNQLKQSRLPKYYATEPNANKNVCPPDIVLEQVLKNKNLKNRVMCCNREDLLAGKKLVDLIEREKRLVECLEYSDTAGSSSKQKQVRKEEKHDLTKLGFSTDINKLIAMRILQEYPDVPDDVGEALAKNYLYELEETTFKKNDVRLYNDLVAMDDVCKY